MVRNQAVRESLLGKSRGIEQSQGRLRGISGRENLVRRTREGSSRSFPQMFFAGREKKCQRLAVAIFTFFCRDDGLHFAEAYPIFLAKRSAVASSVVMTSKRNVSVFPCTQTSKILTVLGDCFMRPSHVSCFFVAVFLMF